MPEKERFRVSYPTAWESIQAGTDMWSTPSARWGQRCGQSTLAATAGARASVDTSTISTTISRISEIYNEKQPDRDKVLADLKQWVEARFL
jgi:hypothetical protein